MTQSQKELVEGLNKCKVEVSKLRTTLNELDKEKESWFRKKEELYIMIKEAIAKIKENKSNRDLLTNEVKELKPKRDSIHKETSTKLKDLDQLKKERLKLAKSLGIKEAPSKIKESIEKLEFRIETEAMSFDKEQALMKKIKELKKIYEAVRVLVDADKKIRETAEAIRKMRKEANGVHESIQEKAKQSQALHEEILKISADIDKLKVEEEYAFGKFSELKKKFNETNAQLKDKLKEMNHIREQLDKIDADKREKRRQQQESFLKSKEEEINQKIKRREKLTTEDLLVFQKIEGK